MGRRAGVRVAPGMNDDRRDRHRAARAGPKVIHGVRQHPRVLFANQIFN